MSHLRVRRIEEAGRDGPSGAGSRILLYSHDSWGLGHLRRSLTIATALTECQPEATALIVTGSPCATHFPLPERVDLVKLPAVSKDAEGHYRPRTLTGPLDGVIELRRRLILETFRAFEPHLLIVDHQVVGLEGEILPVLKEARRRGVRTLLGMRDVIDSPAAVERNWADPDCQWALNEGYDCICVYGQPDIFDPRESYSLPPAVRDRLKFSGYLVRGFRSRLRPPVPSLRDEVVVTVGGGEDGASRIGRYLDALELATPAWHTTIVAGPLFEGGKVRDIKHRARLLGGVDVRRFHSDLPGLLQQARAVVAMAGYNTAAEVLQSGKPVVFLPRTFPREEQKIRAECLARLGLARTLIEPSAGELRAAVEMALGESGPRGPLPNLDGCHYLCGLVDELIAEPGRASSAAWS